MKLPGASLRRSRTYAREQKVLSHWLLQDGGDLPVRWRDIGIAGYHDNTDALVMQPIDQAIGLLTVSQIDVHQRHIEGALGQEAQGVRRGRDWSDNIGTPRLQQHLQSGRDVPGILDDEDA